MTLLQVADMLPLLRGFEPDGPVVYTAQGVLNAAEFCATATAISARLPKGRHVFNLCEGRAEFLLGSAAAWLAGCTLVLPPSRLARTLDDLREAYPDSFCLVDTASDRIVSAIATISMRTELGLVLPSARAQTQWPSPRIAAAQPAAVLFTSGSTGAPQSHCKTWGEFCEGAQTLLRSFGSPTRRAAIMGTVPSQHMFGFETTAMLPLQSGTPLLDACPMYPADLAHALASAARLDLDEIWLMSTPLQLRAFHRDLKSVPKVRRIISATMPLDPELARAIERDWSVTVEEIFGCTEGGILATRRPAQSRRFTPAVGLVFSRCANGATQVSGGQLTHALVLSDRLEPELPDFAGDGRFEVIGRDDDMVKIAGKRASLQALTRELLAVPGVTDGVLFLPSTDAGRIAAIVVAPDRTSSEIRTGLRQRIDPAFIPRPLVIVPALPRDANGKLPMADLNALLAAYSRTRIGAQPAAVANAKHDETFACEWTVPADHPALPGHFPGQAIVPGVVLLERMEALLQEHGYRVCACPQAKFLAPAAPATRLSFDVEMVSLAGDRTEARFCVAVDGADIVVGRFSCVRDRVDA